MKWHRLILLSLLLGTIASAPAHAGVPPLYVEFGPSSWDGPDYTLQKIVDAQFGPGKIDVQHDYVGAHQGDLTTWFWVGSHINALMITEIAGNRDHNVLGWYKELGGKPALDGINDGVVFSGLQSNGASNVVTLSNDNNARVKFGFYLDTSDGHPSDAQPVFYTNRTFNTLATSHAPYGGNVQALVYDVSSVINVPNSWLVCFEDRNTGLPTSATYDPTKNDNDYNDLVFIVTALGATPNATLSFGQLKTRYLR